MTTNFQRVRRSLALSSLLIFTLTTAPSVAAERNITRSVGTFPAIKAENLNEKTFNLPADFPSDRTLLLLGFKREEADTLETWIEGLDLKEKEIAWFEMPVIPSLYSIGGFFIDGAMRRGTPDLKMRERIITLYTDQRAFASSMGIDDQKLGAYVAVVDRKGNNLGFVQGAFSKTKAANIINLLKAK
jgi:hypothetical protein